MELPTQVIGLSLKDWLQLARHPIAAIRAWRAERRLRRVQLPGLPPLPRIFVGRAQEARKVMDAITQDRQVVLHGLTGSGGVGKTTLANYVARSLKVDRKVDEVYFVDLHGFSDPLGPLAAFRVLLGEAMPQRRSEDSDAAFLALVQQQWRRKFPADNRALIILDNAWDEAQVQPLLPDSALNWPKVLITSRNRLVIEGRSLIAVDRLAAGDAIRLARQLALNLTVAQAEMLAVQHCACVPLAIRLAAGRMSATQFPDRELEELKEWLLTHPEVAGIADFALAAMDAETRTDFALLSAWPDAFTLPMARLMLAERAEATIDALFRANLIDPAGQGGKDRKSWRFHDLLRDLGRARLAELPPELRWEIGVQLNAAFNQTISADGPGAALPIAMAQGALAVGDDEAMQRLRGAALDHQGLCLMDLGDGPGARPRVEAALRIRRAWAARDPANAEWQRDLSISLETMGDLTWAAGDAEGAREAYEESLGIRCRLAARDPANAEWQRDLSVSLNKVGDLAREMSDAAAARAAYAESLEIRRQLATRNPANAEWQRDLSISLNKMGDLARDAGDATAARAAYAESLEIRRQLATRNPANAEWQRDLSVSLTKMGDLALAAGDAAAARAAYAESLEIARQLAARDPANVQWAVDLAFVQAKLALVEPAQAKAHLDAALALMRPLAAAGKLTADHQRSLAWMEDERAALD